MSHEFNVTSSNFQKEVAESPVPVLLDFWAEWCMPCKMIGPLVDQLADAYQGKLRVGKVNVDAESDLAMRFNVISIPTLLVLQGGQVTRQKVGALPKQAIEALFKDLV